MHKKIIVLGAGYAGVEAALTLNKNKMKLDDIEITLIDKNSYHTLLTELHEVAGNRIDEDGVIVPLRDIFIYTDVNLVKDEISQFDFKNQILKSESKVYEYDYLIVAAGSQPNFYNIPGMAENSYTIWSYNDAVKIREKVRNSFILASQEKDVEKRKALLSFVVGGGGFTGVEVVGELAQWIKLLCKEYSINRKEVRLILVEALPNILNILNKKNIEKSVNYLTTKLNVEVMTNSPIVNVTSSSVELKSGTIIPTNTLIWTAGIKAVEISQNLCEIDPRGGRIKVNEFTQTEFDNVYAIGDISAFSDGKMTLPALVETALQTGKAAAKNILADLRGKEKQKLHPKLHGVMVSIGSFFAVSELMGVSLPRVLSILMKYMVNIHYLFGIGGFDLVFKYLNHELFEKRQEKFLIEKHYSKKSNIFWLVPLRLFLGYAWLIEGINKVRDHWLTEKLLTGMQTDTDSSASVGFSIIASHTPVWYAWIANNIVIPNAMFFQIVIVLTEIGLGLAFLSGTFTFIAGLVALGLNVNFILSTGLLPETWWFIPAAICMLTGSGRAFGVDYYLIPYLMRQWRYFVRNKNIKLFLFK